VLESVGSERTAVGRRRRREVMYAVEYNIANALKLWGVKLDISLRENEDVGAVMSVLEILRSNVGERIQFIFTPTLSKQVLCATKIIFYWILR
jgi:hypothetical protein